MSQILATKNIQNLNYSSKYQQSCINSKPYFVFIIPICNNNLERERVLSEEILCEHTYNNVQMPC